MDMGIKGRVAIITGGSMGIGGATAELLAQEGVKLVISARREKELADAAAKLRAAGAEVLPVVADCTKDADVQALVKRTVDHYGKLDILVNSIGSAKAGDFLKLSEADWDQSLALKLRGQIRTARAAYPHMEKQRWGRIVNVIGTHALLAEAHAMPAGVANAGLLNFTRAMAELGGPNGVLVNAVSPGTVNTARLKYLMDNGVQYDLKTITLGRFAEAVEIANAIVFLASERASYCCGTVITVDGGQIKTI